MGHGYFAIVVAFCGDAMFRMYTIILFHELLQAAYQDCHCF
jgi:hypothetical protein